MNINMHIINTTIYIQICTSVDDIRAMANKEAELPMLKQFIIRGWLHSKDEVEPGAATGDAFV